MEGRGMPAPDERPGLWKRRRASRAAALVVAALAALGSACLDGRTPWAQTTAEVVTPISLINGQGLRFGAFVPSPVGPGAVLVIASGGRGGVNVTFMPGEFNRALFRVDGDPGAVFIISLPTSITISSPSANMTVDNFRSAPAGTGTINVLGFSLFGVGARLLVGANQSGGQYTGTFDVTVTYQ